MKQKIHVFYKATSFVMAICILAVSCFTFQGCSYEDDYSVLKEDNQVPKVLANTKLSETSDLIVNLKKSLTTKKEISKTLKSAYVDRLKTKFGEPDWDNNQFVSYDNGQKGIYVPLVKDNKITAFILSKPEGDKNKSVVIEVLSENKKGDEVFSGKINFYAINGANMSSYTFKDGKYIPELKSANSQVVRLKSGYTEGDCSTSCLISCLNEVLGPEPIYMFWCGVACANYYTGLGLFICIFCVGGPALHCLDQCCNVF